VDNTWYKPLRDDKDEVFDIPKKYVDDPKQNDKESIVEESSLRGHGGGNEGAQFRNPKS